MLESAGYPGENSVHDLIEDVLLVPEPEVQVHRRLVHS
jgi:hypothetical protein